MQSCLDAPPVPGEALSFLFPSFAFGLVCLSSLESLKNTQKYFSPKGMHRRIKPTALCFLWLLFLAFFVLYLTPIPGDGDSSIFVARMKHLCGKTTNLKAWITTVPNKMNRAEKMRDKRGIISRLHVMEGALVQQETSVLCIICPCKRVKKKCLPTSCYAVYHQLLQTGNHKMHISIGSQTSAE